MSYRFLYFRQRRPSVLNDPTKYMDGPTRMHCKWGDLLCLGRLDPSTAGTAGAALPDGSQSQQRQSQPVKPGDLAVGVGGRGQMRSKKGQTGLGFGDVECFVTCA